MKKMLILPLSVLIMVLPLGDLRAETTVERLVKTIVSQGDPNDHKVYKIEHWVMKNIQYRSDRKQFNMDERWTLPMETLQRRKGDCEDGAILLTALAVTAGVPADRLRLYAPIALPNGWHASVAYQREYDNKWVWVEWTMSRYHPQGTIENRLTMAAVKNVVPMGFFLQVTSLNPFDMRWSKDDELYERAKEIMDSSKQR